MRRESISDLTLDILQANGIAPLPPRPPQDVKPEIIELSDDDEDATAEREEKALRVSANL